MTSRRKKIALLLAVPAGLGVLALGGAAWHYTRPEVQRGLAIDALRSSGLTGDIGGVSVSLSGDFAANDVTLTDREGKRYTLAGAKGDISVLNALFGEFHLGSLELSGVTVDLSKAKTEPAKQGSPVAPAETKQTPTTPARVRIDSADVSGTVVLASGERVAFRTRIRELDTQTGGVFVFDLERASGPVITGEARLKSPGLPLPGETPSDALRRLRPELTADAELRVKRGSPAAVTISLDATSEGVTLVAKSGRSRIGLKASPRTGGEIAVTGDAALDGAALAPWSKDAPAFAATAKFESVFNPATGSASVTLDASGSAEKSPFGENGPRVFALATTFSRGADNRWNIGKLHAKIGSATTPDAITADISDLGVRTTPAFLLESGSSNAADVRLADVPASWLDYATAGKATFPAGKIGGHIRLTRTAKGDIVAETGDEPLHAEGVSILRPGEPGLTGIGASLPLKMSFGKDGALSVAATAASLTRDGKVFAKGDVSWDAGAGGAGELKLETLFSPGVLPDGFLPGGVCEFCAKTGMTVAASVRASRDGEGHTLLKSAKIEGVTGDGVRALAVSLTRPVDTSDIPADGKPVASFAFRGAPLGLFNPLLGGAVLGGVAEKGDLDLARTADGWRVSRPAGGTTANIRGLSWTDTSGVVRLNPTDAQGNPAWESTRAGWKLTLDEVMFTNAAGSALGGRATLAAGDGPLRYDADLAGTFKALAASLPDFAATGIAAGDFTLKAKYAGGRDTAAFDLGIRKLATSVAGPDCDITVNATASESGDTTRFSAPTTFSGPSGTTHATLEGSFVVKDAARVWNVTLAGDTLYADDWIALAAGRQGTTAKPAAGKALNQATPPPASDKAVWANETGIVTAGFEAIRIAGETLEKPKLTVVATGDVIRTTVCETTWRTIPVKADASVNFRRGAAQPYALSSKAYATKVPMGSIVTTFSPNASGMVDGDFDVVAGLAGESRDLASLAGNSTASVDLKSTGGVLRFFKADNEVVRISGELAGMAGDLASDLGRIIGKKAPAAGQALSSVSLLRTALGSIRYDTLTLSAKRLPDGTLQLPGAEVVNDTLRLRASGKLGPGDAAGFAARHAVINATIEGKNVLGPALRALAPAGKKNDGDWISGPDLRFDGPLGNLKNGLLTNLFKSASPLSGDSTPGTDTPNTPASTSEDAVRALDRALNGFGL